MMKAFAYLRVSGKGQITGDGFKRQLEEINSYSANAGYSIENVYKEEAVSGTLDETQRPAFQEMITDILKNGVRTVIIEGMDRLARSCPDHLFGIKIYYPYLCQNRSGYYPGSVKRSYTKSPCSDSGCIL